MNENVAMNKIEKILEGIEYKSISIRIETKGGKTLTMEKEPTEKDKKCGF